MAGEGKKEKLSGAGEVHTPGVVSPRRSDLLRSETGLGTDLTWNLLLFATHTSVIIKLDGDIVLNTNTICNGPRIKRSGLLTDF